MDDDLDDYKLDTTWGHDSSYVIHTSFERDHRDGGRKVRVENKWNRQRELGVGSCGVVHLETTEDGRERAVKSIRKSLATRLRIDYKRELAAISTFSKAKYQQHQIFVEFLGWFENPEFIFVAMEYLPLGDLSMHISEDIKEHDIRGIASQLLDGLKLMHSKGYTHRDLKPQNIFVVQKNPLWWVKIGDFGIAKRVREGDATELRTATGTLGYEAPEIRGYIEVEEDTPSSVYTNVVDIWSFGEIKRFCNNRTPFPTQLLKGKLSTKGIEFLQSILVAKPLDRPTAGVALKHPWLLPLDEEVDFSAQQRSELVDRVGNEHIRVEDLQEDAQADANGEAEAEAVVEAAVEEAMQEKEFDEDLERQIREMDELRRKEEVETVTRRSAEKAATEKLTAEQKRLAEENDRKHHEKEREMSYKQTSKLMTSIGAPLGTTFGGSTREEGTVRETRNETLKSDLRRRERDRDRDDRKSSKSSSTAYQRQTLFFINRDGIDRDVITTDICRYLGNDAMVRPGVHKDARTGQETQGYYITAYRAPSTAQLADLRADSQKWLEEQQKNRPGRAYQDSSVRREIWPDQDTPVQPAYGPGPYGTVPPQQIQNQQPRAYEPTGRGGYPTTNTMPQQPVIGSNYQGTYATTPNYKLNPPQQAFNLQPGQVAYRQEVPNVQDPSRGGMDTNPLPRNLPQGAAYRNDRDLDPEPRYLEARETDFIQRPSREDSDLSVEVRRDFPPPAGAYVGSRSMIRDGRYSPPVRSRSMERDREYGQYLGDPRADRQIRKSVVKEEVVEPHHRSLSRDRKILAGIASAALAIRGKELWDRRQNHGKPPEERNLLATAAVGAAGTFTGHGTGGYTYPVGGSTMPAGYSQQPDIYNPAPYPRDSRTPSESTEQNYYDAEDNEMYYDEPVSPLVAQSRSRGRRDRENERGYELSRKSHRSHH